MSDTSNTNSCYPETCLNKGAAKSDSCADTSCPFSVTYKPKLYTPNVDFAKNFGSKEFTDPSCSGPSCPFKPKTYRPSETFDGSNFGGKGKSPCCGPCPSKKGAASKTRPSIQFDEPPETGYGMSLSAPFSGVPCPYKSQSKNKSRGSFGRDRGSSCGRSTCPSTSQRTSSKGGAEKASTCENRTCPYKAKPTSITDDNETDEVSMCDSSTCVYKPRSSLRGSLRPSGPKPCNSSTCPYQESLTDSLGTEPGSPCGGPTCPFKLPKTVIEEKVDSRLDSPCGGPSCPFKSSNRKSSFFEDTDFGPDVAARYGGPKSPYKTSYGESKLSHLANYGADIGCPCSIPTCPFKLKSDAPHFGSELGAPSRVPTCPFPSDYVQSKLSTSFNGSYLGPDDPFSTAYRPMNFSTTANYGSDLGSPCSIPACPFNESSSRRQSNLPQTTNYGSSNLPQTTNYGSDQGSPCSIPTCPFNASAWQSKLSDAANFAADLEPPCSIPTCPFQSAKRQSKLDKAANFDPSLGSPCGGPTGPYQRRNSLQYGNFDTSPYVSSTYGRANSTLMPTGFKDSVESINNYKCPYRPPKKPAPPPVCPPCCRPPPPPPLDTCERCPLLDKPTVKRPGPCGSMQCPFAEEEELETCGHPDCRYTKQAAGEEYEECSNPDCPYLKERQLSKVLAKGPCGDETCPFADSGSQGRGPCGSRTCPFADSGSQSKGPCGSPTCPFADQYSESLDEPCTDKTCPYSDQYSGSQSKGGPCGSKTCPFADSGSMNKGPCGDKTCPFADQYSESHGKEGPCGDKRCPFADPPNGAKDRGKVSKNSNDITMKSTLDNAYSTVTQRSLLSGAYSEYGMSSHRNSKAPCDCRPKPSEDSCTCRPEPQDNVCTCNQGADDDDSCICNQMDQSADDDACNCFESYQPPPSNVPCPYFANRNRSSMNQGSDRIGGSNEINPEDALAMMAENLDPTKQPPVGGPKLAVDVDVKLLNSSADPIVTSTIEVVKKKKGPKHQQGLVFPKEKKLRNPKKIKPKPYKYKGIQMGHKQCVVHRKNVPNRMGWLWSAKPIGNVELWRGYKPGAVSRTVHKMIRKHKQALGIFDPNDVVRKKRSKVSSRTKSEEKLKHAIEVKKTQGNYYITMNPMKDPNVEECHLNPFVECTPLQFKIVKKPKEERDMDPGCSCEARYGIGADGESSVGSEMDFNFSPPAGLPDLRVKSKKTYASAETQCEKPGGGKGKKGGKKK